MKTKSKTFIREALDSLKDNIDLDALMDIADRYVTSSPISGSWDTELDHELHAIMDRFNISEDEAKEVMIDKLGFDASDFDEIVDSDEFVESLLEAISPQDQYENDLLKSIWYKTNKKANASLSPEEKAVMKKYNLGRHGGYNQRTYLYKNDTGEEVMSDNPDYYRRNKTNWVGKANRPASRKEYNDYIKSGRYDWTPNDIATAEYWGNSESGKWSPEAKAQAKAMSADYREMKAALKADKGYRSKLAQLDQDYEAARQRLMADYQARLRSLYSNQRNNADYYQNAVDRTKQTIDDIKQKHNM